MRPRVAVTGVGLVSALGQTAGQTFDALLAGTRGFAPVSLFDVKDARARLAAEVRGLDIAAVAPAAEARDFSRTDALALSAAREALGPGPRRGRLGIALGGTTGGMLETEAALLDGPLDHVEPARASRLLSHPLDLTTARLARILGGAARHRTLCAACASSALALVQALAWLARGEVDQVLAGGADGLCRLTFFGFDSLGALDSEPCRPFDVARRGLGLGEGAGFLLLERESSARDGGREILGWLSGAATGAEAHHITHPEPSGARAAELFARALDSAGLSPADLDYVNAHGTGTRPNDAMEARALHAALGSEARRVLVSSSKAQLGHTLGAAGAIEAAVTLLALRRGVAPATAGLTEPEDPTLAHVFGAARRVPLAAAASCSFGFGGTGAVLVFERADAPRREEPARPGERVVVTGFAALGAFGEVSTSESAQLFEPAAESRGGALEPPVGARLEPERSRRFDGGAAILTRLTQRALATAGLAPSGVGLAAGTAFGSVERSVRFVLRAVERGVRRANPAEFPHLVASAASGNASIYGRLTGPALGVVDGRAGAEAALALAADWLWLGETDAFVAGAAEGFDPIVADVLGPEPFAGELLPRSEGGGVLVLEREHVARARGARIVASLAGAWELADGAPFPAPAPGRTARAVVVTASPAAVEALGSSSWADCPRRTVLARSGFHEAASALELVFAAALIASGAVDEALVVGGGRATRWLTLLERCEPGA